MNNSEPVLRATNLLRIIDANNSGLTIVDDFSFTFESGRLYSIIGPSGSGKTSLLRLLARLDEPTSGDVLVGGESFRNLNPCHQRRKVAYLFQSPYLFPGSVKDNFRYANGELTDEQASALAAKVSIAPDLIERDVGNLSEGEKQRVALARLLAMNPDILLLDEPTSSLDPTLTRIIEELVAKLLQEEQMCIIMVSHDPQQALRTGGDTLLMVAGKLVESGPAAVVIDSPRTELGVKYKRRELK